MTTVLRSSDPLLQPYRLKHLTLKNRIMSTAHEPNYHEEGMPKDRYRLYHVEKAKGGIALTMTAGSAVVSPDSAPAFGNLFAYKDEIVPWLKKLTDECHHYGCAVMIQLTHLGRRTNWNKADWLPVLSASPVREPAHRSFPKEMEDWGSAKGTRRAFIARDYRLLLLVGDNLGDFTDAYKGSIEERQKVFDDNAAHWGKDWIALPNPTYGSWESAAYGHDFKTPPEEQRQKKIDALKTWSGPAQ